MRHSIRVGLSFGLTSAIITTIGLMIGLYSLTNSKIVIIGGILTIAIADAFSDALGIHVSEESENEHSAKEVWESTISTFLFKFIFALTFIVPVLFLELSAAVYVDVAWGFLLLGGFSFYISKKKGWNAWKAVIEHTTVALIVIAAAYYAGILISSVFI